MESGRKRWINHFSVDIHDWAFTPAHGPQFWLASARINQSENVSLFNLMIAKHNNIHIFQGC
jgi:hypothetical protein